MIGRILVAVDDSAPALAAAEYGVRLAKELSAGLLFVTVADRGGDPEVVLRHVTSVARAAGVPATSRVVPDGQQPYEALLDAALAEDVDLVVMGRSDRRSSGRPYVGSQTEHLLEFVHVPVVVVPESAGATPGDERGSTADPPRARIIRPG
jgi:nucleotide-binding universal stress UspA family protein